MIQPSDFGALRAFATIAEYLSFTRAAEALGVSASALSQTIRGLEERLGLRLLNRTTRSVSLTQSGTMLLAQVTPALNSLSSAFADLRQADGKVAGTVRMHCFHSAAEMFVAPALPGFTRDYPDVVLDLTIDDTVIDIVEHGYDAAIRIGEVIDRDMIAQRLGGDIRQIAVASPAYLAEFGTPHSPQDLLGHNCIRWRWPGQTAPYAWEFCENDRWFSVTVKGSLIASDRSFTLQAALSGTGIAFLKEQSVAAQLADGRLVRLLDTWSAPFPGFYLYYPQQRQMSPALRALIDSIVSANRS